MKFIAIADKSKFPFEVEIDPKKPLIGFKGLEVSKILQAAKDDRKFTISTEDGSESKSFPVFGEPSSVSLFLRELTDLLNLPQVRIEDIQKVVLESAIKGASYQIEEWTISVAAADYMTRKLNIKSREDMYKQIVDYVPSLKESIKENEDLNGRWKAISWYMLVEEMHPGNDVRKRLREQIGLHLVAVFLGVRSISHPTLEEAAKQDRILVDWSPLPVIPESSDLGFFIHFDQEYDTLQVAIRYDWQTQRDGIHAKISRFGLMSPFLVTYRLYKDGRFTLLTDEDEFDLEVNPIGTDIPVPHETKLFVPIPDVETLDIMLGIPTTFKTYAGYNMFTNVYVPVSARWNSPVEAMFVLDRLSTMLTTGMVISDYRKPQNGSRPFRYVHPQVLKSLLSQVLLNQYLSKSTVSLNRIAYAWLWLNRHFGDVLREFPWQKVTVGGWEDMVAFVNTESVNGYAHSMQRSFPTLEEYIRERRAVAGAIGYPVQSEDTILMTRPLGN